MTEEKQTEIITQTTMPQDDVAALKYVLEHVRGTMPSSLSAPVLADDE